MSRSPTQRYFTWPVVFFSFEVFVVLMLLGAVAATHGEIGASYSRDVSDNAVYCASLSGALDRAREKDCQSYWYRTLNDPAISWNFYYSCLTLALVLSAIVTIFVGLRSIRIQSAETRELFVVEHRPRLKVTMRPKKESFAFDGKGMAFQIEVSVINIGKAAAHGVSIPWFSHEWADVKGMESRIKALRNAATQWSGIIGVTLYNGDELNRIFTCSVIQEELDRTWDPNDAERLFRLLYVYVSVPYRDDFNADHIYESSPCGYLTIAGPMAPWPRNQSELKSFTIVGDGPQIWPVPFLTITT